MDFNRRLFCRWFAWSVVGLMFVFLFNNYLFVGRSWPGATAVLGEAGFDLYALLQALFYVGAIFAAYSYAIKVRFQTLFVDSERLTNLANYIIRAAFWAVLLIGLVDMAISLMRVEDVLSQYVGDDLAASLGLSRFRGPYVHFPLALFSLIIAYFVRDLGFAWLTLLVVLAEFQIVITRFIFSYEQAFMGDLVRFWYAALFLFASAHTLVEEGHVRVDVFFAGFRKRTKAWVNFFGSVLLGMSLCAVVLFYGMATKASIINGPVVSFEVTQSGFGMFVKYIMAIFLAVFAVSMMIQFASYLLSNAAVLLDETDPESGEQRV